MDGTPMMIRRLAGLLAWADKEIRQLVDGNWKNYIEMNLFILFHSGGSRWVNYNWRDLCFTT